MGIMGKDKDKDVKAFAGAEFFRQKHSCNVICVTHNFVVVGGKKIHLFKKESWAYLGSQETPHPVSALKYVQREDRLYIGLDNGMIMKICYLGKEEEEDAKEKPNLICEDKKGKCHSASIVDLEYDSSSTPFLYSAASDGTLAIWDGSIQRTEYPPSKPKKTPKGCITKIFPNEHCAIVSTPEGTSLLTIVRNDSHAQYVDNNVEFTSLPDKHVKAIAGYKGEKNLRVFLGGDAGSVNIYDVDENYLQMLKVESGTLSPKAVLDGQYTTPVRSLCMFGQFLVGSANDNVTLWNTRETSAEHGVLQKFAHKGIGVVSATFAEGLPGVAEPTPAIYCYNKTNEKIFVIKMENLQSLSGHSKNPTLHIDPTQSQELGKHLDAQHHGSNPSPDRLSVPSPVGLSLTPASPPSPSHMLAPPRQRGSLKFKDFYADGGVIQDLMVEAQAWIESESIDVLSINTVPMIGSTSCEDPMFLKYLDKCAYDAAIRTVAGGDIQVPIIQVLRVMYYG